MFDEYSDVLTVKQMARALGIGFNLAYRLVDDETIGSVKVGNKILVPKACVIDFMNSARTNEKVGSLSHQKGET